MVTRAPVRCAVYTRKSSEEGLEQSFNSLDAQREACEAYILSQKHEGWILVPGSFDDGGFSGGSMKRPGLAEVMAAVEGGLIDIIVVYKVDRLTRSLADFAKMVEVFDRRGVSFVSITQAFNTTSSMGRLTLNVLLSFAQFEREVAGERIRDKIAASKAKGMWMGGLPPLGYDPVETRLVINEAEASHVRKLFALYRHLRSVDAVIAEAAQLGITSKLHESAAGRISGGSPISRGQLYRMLQNPIYVGDIRHGSIRYKGQHAPLLPHALFNEVQSLIAGNRRREKGSPGAGDRALLCGLLHDESGYALGSTHSCRGKRRYRYYASSASAPKTLQLPAQELERLTVAKIAGFLASELSTFEMGEIVNSATLAAQGRELEAKLLNRTGARLRATIENIVHKIVVFDDRLEVKLVPAAVCNLRGVAFSIPLRVSRSRKSLRLVFGNQESGEDRSLVALVAQGRTWLEEIVYGEAPSIAAIAAAARVTERYVSRLIGLAFIDPLLAEVLAAGCHPAGLTASDLKYADVPADFSAQRTKLKLHESNLARALRAGTPVPPATTKTRFVRSARQAVH